MGRNFVTLLSPYRPYFNHINKNRLIARYCIVETWTETDSHGGLGGIAACFINRGWHIALYGQIHSIMKQFNAIMRYISGAIYAGSPPPARF